MSQVETQRRARSGWSEQETQLLWEAIRNAKRSSRPLKEVFHEVADATGRQPNSIRNYYYTVAKAQGEGTWKPLTFVPFQERETRQLIREILIATARGETVRACVQRLAQDDRTVMLRYQNKYRAVLKTRPELIKETLAELKAEGIAAVNPYERIESRKRRNEGAASAKDEDAYTLSFAPLGPEALPVVRGLRKLISQVQERLVDMRALQEENDRLKVQVDLLRLELAKREDAEG